MQGIAIVSSFLLYECVFIFEKYENPIDGATAKHHFHQEGGVRLLQFLYKIDRNIIFSLFGFIFW